MRFLDLADDRYERCDLAPEDPRTAGELRARSEAHARRAVPPKQAPMAPES